MDLIRVGRSLACAVLALSVATSAAAQSGEEAALRNQIEDAFAAGDGERTAELIGRHRFDVKPIVTALIGESIEAHLEGDETDASRKLELASRMAATFEERFGEKSLVQAADLARRLSPEQMRAKLHADSLLARGRGLRSGDEAMAAYTDALAIFQALDDGLGIAETLGGIGVVYWYKGRGDSTLATFKLALEARRTADDRRLVGNSLSDIGSSLLYFERDYGKALEWYLQAARVREAIGDSASLARSYNLIANAYREIGAPDSSLAYYEEAVAVNRQIGEDARLVGDLVGAGRMLMEMGRSSEAISRLNEAIEFGEAGGDTAQVADALNWKGASYRRVGDFESAIAAYQEVIRLAGESGADALMAYARLNIGVLLEYAERSEQAVRHQEEALAVFESLADARGLLLAALGLSTSYTSLKDYEKAERYAQRALDASREQNDLANEARALITLGNAQVLSGDADAARANFALALEQATVVESPELRFAALLGHGDYHDRRGEYERAIEYYESGLEVAENVRGSLFSDEERAGFLAQKRFAYEHIVHMLGKLHAEHPERGFDGRAFQVAERAKARSFLDLIAESVSGIREGVDPELLKRQTEVIEEIAEVQRQIHAAAAAGAPEAAPLRARLDDLDEAYRELRRELRLENPAYSQLKYPEPATLQQVQSDLVSPNTVLLQYALGDSSSSLWVVTAETARMHELPNRSVLQEQIELLRFALQAPDTSSMGIFAEAAHELYRLLIQPAEALVAAADQLIIVPDGALYYVPFEALLTDPVAADTTDYAALPYLIRRSAVSYGPSASVLLQLADAGLRDGDRSLDLLAFGDPVFSAGENQDDARATSEAADALTRAGLERLPHTGTEVRSIAALFQQDRVDAFLREDAVEERIKADNALLGYRYIHFATHGLIDERRPDFSSIVLTQTGDGTEDGYLQAAEIFNLRMNPELVVLSACETGLGKLVEGEGLVGLTRAFMYAGAPSIAVSLWRVADESTSHLMQRFYEGLAAPDAVKSAALQGAKLQLIEGDKFSHPFHWAPFILIGDSN